MSFANIRFILRRFNRQKLKTALHITGLTLGISICLIIGLFIPHELANGIALLTISFQSIRSALANPIKSLKNE